MNGSAVDRQHRSAREFDVVLYGAAGFVGRQTAEYMSAHAPQNAGWAIAGRSRARLDAVRAGLKGPRLPRDIVIADSGDPASVDSMVRRASVVLSTAGPFALYGTPVVDACVRYRTHYVDITGETQWIRQMIERYHDRAAADGTRIITCCGFDSVPSDIGTLLVARTMRSTVGAPCAEVRGYFQLYGGRFNGGTVASALNQAGSTTDGRSDPFFLDPPVHRSPRQAERSRDLRWPIYDPQAGTWIAPFFMAPINTRVVRRSAALQALWGEPYGDDFVYQEALKLAPPRARAKAIAMAFGLAAFDRLLRWAPGRRLLAMALPKPGEGPSQNQMDDSGFSYEVRAMATDGRMVCARMRHRGDAGNRATTKFVCESALALCGGTDTLPGGPGRGGVLTPATGLGIGIVERLRAAGLELEIENHD